jgi:hypothetical protein
MGTAALAAEELAAANKYMVAVGITSATADAAGVVTVNFTVMNDTTPVTTVPSVGAGIFKLVPAGSGFSYNRWVPYIWRTEPVVGTQEPPSIRGTVKAAVPVRRTARSSTTAAGATPIRSGRT